MANLKVDEDQLNYVVGQFDGATSAVRGTTALPRISTYSNASATISSFLDAVRAARSTLEDASQRASTTMQTIHDELEEADLVLARDVDEG